MKFMRLLTLFTALGVGLASAGIADKIDRHQIDGIDVIVLRTGVKNVVTLTGMMPAGDASAPADNPALASLTGAMLDKGTTQHDKFAIAGELESVGASLSFGVGNEMLSINGKCLTKDVPLLLNLIAEQLRTPAFDPAEFEKVKQQYVAALKQSLDDTNQRAADAYSRAVYPVGHPNRQTPTDELIAAAETTTLDAVKAFHHEYYGPAHLTLVLVGDADATGVKSDITQSFAGWSGGQEPKVSAAKGGNIDASQDQTVFMADKTNVSVVWGMATGLRYSDPGALALRVGTNVLGGGFTARLMGNVRDKEGLTYGIYGYVSGDNLRDGDWRIQANFSPDLLDKGIASTKRQLTKWYQDGITAEELATRKADLTGSYKVGLSTSSGMARAILSTLQRGYDLTWLDQYPEAVNSLTLAQVNGAIKKHLDPNKMVIVKAGTVIGADAK